VGLTELEALLPHVASEEQEGLRETPGQRPGGPHGALWVP